MEVSTAARRSRSRARHHVRQAVIRLGADDDIDIGRAGGDLLALRLGDAACDREQHLPAAALTRLLQRAQPPELGIDLLRRLLTDMAGVENHQVGVLDLRCRAIAERRQDIRHAGGVVDVHLAAEGLDVELFRHGLAVCRGLAGGRAARRSCRSLPLSKAADPSTRRNAVKRTRRGARPARGPHAPSSNAQEDENGPIDLSHILGGEDANPSTETLPAYGGDLVNHDPAGLVQAVLGAR